MMRFGLYAPLQHINLPREFEPRYEGDTPYKVARAAVRAATRSPVTA